MTSANESMVYAFGSTMTTRIKIGTSINVNGRLGQIQGMCPFPLSVLWRTQGDHRLEDALHKRFEDRRVHGEWFEFAGVEDPVTEIAAASEIETARLAAVESNWTPVGRPDWQPEVSIVEIEGAVLVMPSPREGGWRCTALSEKRGRRCSRMMDDRALFELLTDWTYWVVPGLGIVTGRGFAEDTSNCHSREELARMRTALLSQVCSKHLNYESRLPATWRPFDLRLDIESITPWGYSSILSGVMPGLELLDEEVRDYVFGELSMPLQLVLPDKDPDAESTDALSDFPMPTLPLRPLRESLRRGMAESYLRVFGPYLAAQRGATTGDGAATLPSDVRIMLDVFARVTHPLSVSRAIDRVLPQPDSDDYQNRRRYAAYCDRWAELSRATAGLATWGYLQVAKQEVRFPGDPNEFEITDAGRKALATTANPTTDTPTRGA